LDITAEEFAVIEALEDHMDWLLVALANHVKVKGRAPKQVLHGGIFTKWSDKLLFTCSSSFKS